MEPLSYQELEQETINFISQTKQLVLATCTENRVTARTMSVINRGLVICFQTDLEYTKTGQIRQNPNVALCAGNMQLEGTARFSGHPLADPWFIENYRRVHERAFKKYSHLESDVIIEVEPRLVTFWKYDADHNPYRDYLDVAGHRAYREVYEKAYCGKE
jgi:uncharacterized pyridoxamine 5'-phosphate oxidase family protein